MTAIYDRACTTCGHKINDHDVNECWRRPWTVNNATADGWEIYPIRVTNCGNGNTATQ